MTLSHLKHKIFLRKMLVIGLSIGQLILWFGIAPAKEAMLLIAFTSVTLMAYTPFILHKRKDIMPIIMAPNSFAILLSLLDTSYTLMTIAPLVHGVWLVFVFTQKPTGLPWLLVHVTPSDINTITREAFQRVLAKNPHLQSSMKLQISPHQKNALLGLDDPFEHFEHVEQFDDFRWTMMECLPWMRFDTQDDIERTMETGLSAHERLALIKETL